MGQLTPLVLIQQIVVELQDVVLAGPQTCEAPLPLQQYGEPELQRFCAIGFCLAQFGLGGEGGAGGPRGSAFGWGSRLSSLGPSAIGELFVFGSAKGMARPVVRHRVTRARRVLLWRRMVT